MDHRLFRIFGQRPHRLLKRDVPELAVAITAFLRGRATITRHVVQDVPCLHFSGDTGINLVVRSDDWAKVVPYLKDESFSPTIVPVARPGVLHASANYSPSVAEIRDPELYERVVTALNLLFPNDYPTI